MGTNDEVAAELRAELARRRIPNRRIAGQLGWSETYLSRRLTGSVPFSIDDLASVASAIGIPVAAFFDEARPRVVPFTLALAAAA
ncbi:MAG TPA: helix-turn-helix domain-containing protein [Streptosporangiaceae bacterium]|jgi:transcriptional regulator with XRE-family HTH domain